MSITHLAALPRRYPSALPVAHIGFLPGKRYRVRHGFRSWNFSFLLAGHGTYAHHGRLHAVSAPCVLTQWPGQECDYGPTGAWDELFLIYAAEHGPRLQAMGFSEPQRRPFWHLGPNRLHPLLLELKRLLRTNPLQAPTVDRIDRVCEQLILESLLAAGPTSDAPTDAVARIRALVEADCLAEHDFAALAQSEGLSEPHFRRLWRRAVGCPPERFRTGLRMAQACRLLVEGDLPVAAIGRAVGFADPLHFSRRFRATLGSNPAAYRTHHCGELPRP
jgi:AraC-like DNA-binding protein